MVKDSETPKLKKLKLNEDLIKKPDFIMKNKPSVSMYFANAVDSKSKLAATVRQMNFGAIRGAISHECLRLYEEIEH